jgi:hypothetical protein
MQQLITAQETKNKCPICPVFIANSLGEHIRKEHGEKIIVQKLRVTCQN